ncbi:MAG: aspartate kinase [Chitinophagales bacterium]
MKVFKFGGASVQDAQAIRNVAAILQQYKDEKLVIVISAMGKTTNSLEDVTNAYYDQTGRAIALFETIKEELLATASALFEVVPEALKEDLVGIFTKIEEWLNKHNRVPFNFIYDQIVSAGELLSTTLISHFLRAEGTANQWIDIRNHIKTDNTYREGQVNWSATTANVQAAFPSILNKEMIVTQGFLGGTNEGFTTTLGREGSDYTAAILSNVLNADSMTVWKDVPAILNADPRVVKETVKIPRLSYYEAIEMTYYGAKVIHPNTIKPLQNKNIPLHVRSFIDTSAVGTTIHGDESREPLPTIIVFDREQLLLSISSKDFSFMAENNLAHIYELFAKYRIKTNLSQNGAISFKACIDNKPNRIKELLVDLLKDYNLQTTANVEIITLRHYTPASVKIYTKGKDILMTQKGRDTLQMVVKA